MKHSILYLINHTEPISYHWLFMALASNTHTHTQSNIRKPAVCLPKTGMSGYKFDTVAAKVQLLLVLIVTWPPLIINNSCRTERLS